MDLLTEMDMKASKGNFEYFFTKVLGFEMAPFHREWLERVQTTQRTVTICSRDHGKSVFFHSWCVYQLCFQDPGYEIIYISSNQKQTMVHMKDIDRMFSTIPALKKFKPKAGWAVGRMELTNGNRIIERSVGSQIRGLHPDEIIIDDPMKEFSMTAIQRVSDWFWGDMIPTLHHTSSLRMIGTPFTYTDIFAELEENTEYDVKRYPAINQERHCGLLAGILIRWTAEEEKLARLNLPVNICAFPSLPIRCYSVRNILTNQRIEPLPFNTTETTNRLNIISATTHL